MGKVVNRKQWWALLIGFVFGVGLMFCIASMEWRPGPSVPKLKAPVSIEVTLYPWIGGVEFVGEPVLITSEKLDLVRRMLTPEKFYDLPIHDFITPIVAKAIVKHADGKVTTVLIREGGVNPALVTVDGMNYFYARNDPDIASGATELISLVGGVYYKIPDKPR